MPTFFSLSNLSFHSLLFLSFSILLVRHSFTLQQPLCHDDDHSSLLQFKHSFVFDKFRCDPSANYAKLSSWKVGDDCCSWDGVQCDDETGLVIGLDLSSSCLFGSINSSSPLFRLVHLTSLDLSYNNFNLSTIPSGIRSLSQLRHLNLTFSHFSSQIPQEILELSNLVSLDLTKNKLMLKKPSLKDLAEKLNDLTQLHLSGVTISAPVPHSLSNLTSLSSLLLKNCSLLGEFPSGIFQLPNLRVLNLRFNPSLTGYLPEFDGIGNPLEKLWLDRTNFSGRIPVSIGNLKSLRVFTANECGFGGVIPSSVGNLSNLNALGLSKNYFSGKIPSSLGNLFRLTYLSLDYNNFSAGNLNWVYTLSNLQSLYLSETNTFGPIPSSLRNLTQLVAMALGENTLTGQIPCWLGNFTQLVELGIADNELQGPIPESMFGLPNLELLYLDSNNLSGSLKFDSFLQMKHLVYLQLSGNHLSIISSSPYINDTLPKFLFLGLAGCNLREFPSFLRGSNEIEQLFLDSNNIEGYIPNWIFTLESLSFLSLTNNSLTGLEQPLSVLPSANLRSLDLTSNKLEGPLPIPSPSILNYKVSQNKFSGEISPLFCYLTSILVLDLSHNNLSGNLPSCLGNLGNFASVLNLKNNNLLGKIPDSFTGGCSLQLIDFSQNKIEEKVPRSLANCSKLEILNLEKNHINDVFPSWLGILPRLRVLSLRFNNFYGSIGKPLRKFEFDRLQIIDLSQNYFTGKLPLEYFSNWVSMRSVDNGHLAYMQANTSFEVPGYSWNYFYSFSITIVIKGTERAYDQILEFFVVIDLSSNKFEGEIPEIIGTLRELQSLNLSNNMLSGHIPSSLGNLTKLEALDLSINKLSGDIPIQLVSLNFLAVLNVSHNSLTGPVPRGKQFDTFNNDSFSANAGLCGYFLSTKCVNTETLPLPPSEVEDADSPFELNWEIVLIGFSSGLVIGVAFGYAMDTRKYERHVKKMFVRQRRRRRN